MLTLSSSESWKLSPWVLVPCQEEKEETVEKTKVKSPENYEENQESGIPEAN